MRHFDRFVRLTPSAQAGSSSSMSTRMPFLGTCEKTVSTPSQRPPLPSDFMSNLTHLGSKSSASGSSSGQIRWLLNLTLVTRGIRSFAGDLTKKPILIGLPRCKTLVGSLMVKIRWSFDDECAKSFYKNIKLLINDIECDFMILNHCQLTTSAVTKSSNPISIFAPVASADGVSSKFPRQPSLVRLKN